MKQYLTKKQTCNTCNKEVHDREHFMYELYSDFCEVLNERGLLEIEMEQDYLPEFVETYWDHFSEDLVESEGEQLEFEPQELDGDERWYIYLETFIENRTVGFECTNCIISRTPHP